MITNCQFGFRRGRSTIKGIYSAVVEILESVNQNKHTVAVCLDLSKAFDSVDHSILIEKMERYGIRGVALKLVVSYLKDRMQQVVERNERGAIVKSELARIKKGVPQGSIIGPLLYVLYTNELPSLVRDHVVMYADDTSVIMNKRIERDLEQHLEGTLDSLQGWFTDNNLLMNVDKTQIIKFSARDDDTKTYSINNVDIETSKTVSFLGMTIDTRLDWKAHVAGMSSELTRYCYALRVLTQEVGLEASMNVYHAQILSRIRYGIIFWGNSVGANRVQIMQKRFLRVMFGMRARESCRRVFREKS